jgi:hypothetical protein
MGKSRHPSRHCDDSESEYECDNSGNLVGPPGRDGMDGRDGRNGRDGHDGAPGPKGCRGATGAQGLMGPQGYTGSQGSTGSQGDTGSQGPTGWSGKCLNSFMRAYNDVTESVELEQAFTFNKNDVIKGLIRLLPGTGQLLLCTPGYYMIIGKLYHLYALQVGCYLNNVLLPGSVVGESATTSVLLVHDIVAVSAADLLPNVNSPTGFAAVYEIKNHSSFITPVILDGRAGSGSDLTQVNASIVAVQLCDEDPLFHVS